MSIVERIHKPKESYPDKAKRIEGELADRVARLHILAGSLPRGQVHELLKREQEKRLLGPIHKTVAELITISSDFERLFREIPPNYHLEIEISPKAYGAISDQNLPQARAERVDNQLRYYVDCGIYVGKGEGKRSVVTIEAIPPQGDYALPSLGLKQAGDPPFDKKHLNLKDINNVKVVRNPGTFHPITILPSSK